MQQYLPFTVLKLVGMLNIKCSHLLVATVLTVYGIETKILTECSVLFNVATVLTVYGIETLGTLNRQHSVSGVATVLTVYGIETPAPYLNLVFNIVATVLTVYGIETLNCNENILLLFPSCNSTYRLRY